jgi:hypothetical protein
MQQSDDSGFARRIAWKFDHEKRRENKDLAP